MKAEERKTEIINAALRVFNERGYYQASVSNIIEQAGIIPQKGEKVKFENYEFTVMASDKRKVKQIQLTIIDENEKL